MVLYPTDSIFERENAHKEDIYNALDEELNEKHQAVIKKKDYVSSGAFDDHDAFTAHSDLNIARKQQQSTEEIIQALYSSPYFSHIDVLSDNESEVEHYFLSDCETLDEAILIKAQNSSGFLLPFKLDPKRPVSAALQQCYSSGTGEPITYPSPNNGDELLLQPVVICRDEISNRLLINAIQLFPATEFSQQFYDEVLEKKLSEGRNNPSLQNIISTLQQKQFEIIDADPKESFVVQGCAGSGKSQCLLHRLFYLRSQLYAKGWEHVLLLTPTKLFRNYSAELIKRYQLSDVKDCSLAELYQAILNAYDIRFRDRQYHFELTEEYLPDEYLQIIYHNDTIQKIEDAIDSAARKYAAEACSALGIKKYDTVTNETISELIHCLDAEIDKYNTRESILSQDHEYEHRRSEYDQLQKQQQTKQKSFDRLTVEQAETAANIDQLTSLIEALQEARLELQNWMQERSNRISSAIKKLSECVQSLNGNYAPDAPAKYAHQLYIVRNLTSGVQFKSDEEYLSFLREIIADAEKGLNDYAGKQKPARLLSRYQKKQEEQQEKLRLLSEEIDRISHDLEECTRWLTEKGRQLEGEKSSIILQKSQLDHSRYSLSRLESTIFEQAVWDVLLPYKKKYNVRSLDITTENGHQRETRILYKSDLLFYIKVYSRLHQSKKLPEYSMLCIDEGQDFHKADYDMLHFLFPAAVFNIFGDTSQVLHTACGVSDWEKETGIHKVYSLEQNYRNPAAIVDFCNERFNSRMTPFGKVRKEQRPVILKTTSDLQQAIKRKNIVLIVKDKECYMTLCRKISMSIDDFEFLDTTAEKVLDERIPCYSIFAAKGLEFSNVIVYSREMTINQKIVACTRAMEGLYYYE